MKYFVHRLEHNAVAVACCGETRVDNKAQSFITMMEVFEYYAAHHMKKVCPIQCRNRHPKFQQSTHRSP
jgi:cellulose synthase/poly-beta-1,6-N-acetylglucosamine synthase-like glycosyltransferase